MIGEGGDDIFVGSDAQDKMDGMSGFDWVTYKNDKIGVTVDLELAALNEPPDRRLHLPHPILDRFAEVEGLSGSTVRRLSCAAAKPTPMSSPRSTPRPAPCRRTASR